MSVMWMGYVRTWRLRGPRPPNWVRSIGRRSVRFSCKRFEKVNRVIDFLFHALQGSGIDFVRGRDEIDGLEGLSFRPKSHRLVKGSKPQAGIGRDIEGELGGSGF